ncbi:tyrosine-type recombinase/integrase [Bradyrhizobium sp. RT4b]|uniref:tyrosine-type recombinase/integrase n=1 Tax=unclassified Bradyrhizobium TaxID=2631580 RepID=UPI0033946713
MLQRVEVQRTDYLYRKVAKGRPYLYFRFPKEFGVKLVSLPVDEASKAFQHQYDFCRAKLRKLEADRDKVKPAPRVKLARSLPGTIGKAIETYRVSDSFTGLKPGTQTIYIGRLDKLKAQFGNEPLREVNRDAAERMASEMDYLARLDRVKAKYGSEIDGDAAQRLMDKASPQMWDLYITLLSNIWKAARAADPDNVIFGIRKLPSPTLEIDQKHKDTHCQPHMRWPDDLIERFDETAPDYLVLARMVLHFTSQRGGDAVRMKWEHYDGKGVKVWPEKTTRKGMVLEPAYHLLPDVLIEALDKAKEETATSDYILVSSEGRKWATRRSMSQAIKAHLVMIGARMPKQKKGYTAHGLRHTGASEVAALPGANSKGVQTITGHKSLRQPERYMEQADKARINEAMVEAWNADIARRQAERAARRKAAIKLVKR